MTGNRWVVTTLLLCLLFGIFAVVGTVYPLPAAITLETSDTIETLFQALLGATVTGVTIIVTINQLVLSQELGPVGEQHDRMEQTLQFQTDVEQFLDEPVSPAEPSMFLRAIIKALDRRGATLEQTLPEIRDEQARTQVDTYATALSTNATAVADRLDTAEFGTFTMILAALDYNYSWKLFTARRIRAEHDASLPPAAHTTLANIIEVLKLFGTAREHFKTLYFRWTLIDLSRVVLVAAAPALVVSISMILYGNDIGPITEQFLGVDAVVWVVSAGVTITLAPFAVLLSYILRITTIAKRTLAIGPFVLRDVEQEETIEEK